MNKETLESGMMIQTRNGYVWTLVNGTLVSKYRYDGGFMYLSSYKDDLTHVDAGTDKSEWDIVLVTEPLTGYHLTNDCDWDELLEDVEIFEMNLVPRINWFDLPLVEQTDELDHKRLIKVTSFTPFDKERGSFSGICIWDDDEIHEIGYQSDKWSMEGCTKVVMTHYDKA